MTRYSVLLALAGLLTVVEASQAQVRIVIGVGGRGPSYYSRGTYPSPYWYPYTYPRYAYPPTVIGVPPVVVRDAYPPLLAEEPPLAAPAAQQPQGNTANVRVLVPNSQAKVWFDGALTKQTGTDRLFHTPTLVPGSSYSYRIRAAWTQNGEEMVQESVVSVSAGQTSVVDFTKPYSEAVPPPK